MREPDKFYLRIACAVAQASYAERLQVGSILVKDGNIISFGYNGTPAGFDNNCEMFYHGVTKPEVLHAESNAITKCAKSVNSSEGSTLYTTDSPCFECAKLIIQAGIKRVVYARGYRKDDGIKLLKKANIIIDEILL